MPGIWILATKRIWSASGIVSLRLFEENWMKSKMDGTIAIFASLDPILCQEYTLYFLPVSVDTTDFKNQCNLENLEETDNELHSTDDSNEALIYLMSIK